MKSRPDPMLLTGVVCAVALLLVLGGWAWRSTGLAASQAADAQRAQAVLTALALLQSAATDAETAQRGFALTGDASFLEPLQPAQSATAAQTARLRDLLAVQAEQYSRLVALGPLLTRRLEALQAQLQAPHPRARAAAGQPVAPASAVDDKRLHDRVRAAVAELQQHAQADLSSAQQRSADATSQARSAVAALAAAALLLVAAAGAWLWRVRSTARHSRVAAASAQDSQAQARAALQQVFDAATDAIFVLDAEGRFVQTNAGCEAVFGVPAATLQGRACIELITPDDQRKTEQALNAAQAQPGTVQRFRSRCKRPGGTVATVWSCKALPGGEQLLCIVHDSSEHETLLARHTVQDQVLKQQQVELAQNQQRAERADRSKAAFLAAINHDLRTPLNTIIGGTGVLQQGLAGPLTSDQNKQLLGVRDAARQLLERVGDALDFAHLEAGELALAQEPVDLWETIQKAATTARPLLEHKGLTLQLQVADGLGYARGDARRVQQVLQRLLLQAMAGMTSGAVLLKAGPQADGRLQVCVRGAGAVLAPEALAALFEPFRSTAGGHTGLALAQRVVQLMDGELGAGPAEGDARGMQFVLVLPADGLGA